MLNEVQKILGWSEALKRLWDEDSRKRVNLRVVLLGSVLTLIRWGLTESLAGRFEVTRLPHWSLAEREAAFGWSLNQYVFLRCLSRRGIPHRRIGAVAREAARRPQPADAFSKVRPLIVGEGGVPVDEFLRSLWSTG